MTRTKSYAGAGSSFLSAALFALVVGVAGAWAQPSTPQPMSSLTAAEYFESEGIKIGINVGNTLDAVNNPTGGPYIAQEDAWGNPLINQAYLNSLAAMGFNAVRIPITYTGLISPGPSYSVDLDRLDRIAQVLDMVETAGLKAIINVHHDGNISHGLGGWLDITKASTDPSITARFEAIWTDVAEHLKNYGDFVMFQAFNEIHDGDWGSGNPTQYNTINDWNQRFTNIVRESGGNNEQRYLLYYGYNTTYTIGTNSNFQIPADNVKGTPQTGRQIVGFHYYYPYEFSHDGTSYTWDDSYNRNHAQTAFANMKTKFVDNGIPVIIGEVGPVRYQGSGNAATAHQNRLEFIDFLYGLAAQNDIVPFYWEVGNAGTDFDLITRATGQPNSTQSAEVIERMVSAVNGTVPPPPPPQDYFCMWRNSQDDGYTCYQLDNPNAIDYGNPNGLTYLQNCQANGGGSSPYATMEACEADIGTFDYGACIYSGNIADCWLNNNQGKRDNCIPTNGGTLVPTCPTSTQYSVSVTHGTIDYTDYGTKFFDSGDLVTITANAPASSNSAFSHWTVSCATSCPPELLANPNDETTTFTMPSGNVTVTANYDYAHITRIDGFTFGNENNLTELGEYWGNYLVAQGQSTASMSNLDAVLNTADPNNIYAEIAGVNLYQYSWYPQGVHWAQATIMLTAANNGTQYNLDECADGFRYRYKSNRPHRFVMKMPQANDQTADYLVVVESSDDSWETFTASTANLDRDAYDTYPGNVPLVYNNVREFNWTIAPSDAPQTISGAYLEIDKCECLGNLNVSQVVIPTLKYELDVVESPYTFLDRTPLIVTVSNTSGTAPTGDLTITLIGTDIAAFEIDRATITSIAAGGTAQFTLTPKSGLTPEREYMVTVSVTSDGAIAQTFVAFYTEPQPDYYCMWFNESDGSKSCGLIDDPNGQNPDNPTMTNLQTCQTYGMGSSPYTNEAACMVDIDNVVVQYCDWGVASGCWPILRPNDPSSENTNYPNLEYCNDHTPKGAIASCPVEVATLMDDFSADRALSFTGEKRYNFTAANNGGTVSISNSNNAVNPNGYIELADIELKTVLDDWGDWAQATIVLEAANNGPEYDLSKCTRGFRYSYKGNEHQFSLSFKYGASDLEVAYIKDNVPAVTEWTERIVRLADLLRNPHDAAKTAYPTAPNSSARLDELALTKELRWTVRPYDDEADITGYLQIDDCYCLGEEELDLSGVQPSAQVFALNAAEHSFAPENYGYTSVTPFTVTVTNVTDTSATPKATGPLNVVIHGIQAAAFEVSSSTLSSIAAGETDEFTIKPADGLPVGTYEANIVVSGDPKAWDQAIHVTFVVVPEEVDIGTPVTAITGVPTSAIVGVPLMLTGVVEPDDATNKTIVWSIANTATTTATVVGGVLHTTAANVGEFVTVRATIIDGVVEGTPFVRDFNIEILADPDDIDAVDNAIAALGTVSWTVSMTGTALEYKSVAIDTVTSRINGVVWGGPVTAAPVIGGAFTPAIAGTAVNPLGTNGSLAFTVSLSKGGYADTYSGTLVIIATPYVPPTYTVSFDTQGGTPSTIADVTVVHDETITAPTPEPTRTGHTFKGWFTAATGGTQWPFGLSKVTSDMTLYAQWTINTYTVTFNTQGGSAVSPITGVTHGSTIAEPSEPTYADHTFNGWFTTATGNTKWNFATSTVTSPTTLYAQWTADVTYTITFNANGGSVNPTSGTTGAGQKLASLPTPTRASYIFNGWFTAATDGTAVTTSTVFSANTEIFAQWSEKSTLVATNLSFNPATIVYNGTARSVTVTPGSGVGTVTAVLYSDKETVPTDAGTYAIKVNVAEGAQYKAATGLLLGNFTITKATQTAPTTLVRTHVTVNGANNGTISGVTTAMEYKLSTATAYTDCPAGTITGLAPGTYHVRLKETANHLASADVSLTIDEGKTSILSGDRDIPNTPDFGAAVIAPVHVTAFELAAGPNPVRKTDGVVNVFLSGKRINSGTLTVFDATGNVVRKIDIRDNAAPGKSGSRIIGSWDLKDAKGKPVSEGAYLLRGSVKTVDGKREKVSVMIGVR